MNVSLFGVHAEKEQLYFAAQEPKAFLRLKGQHAEALEVMGQVYVDSIKAFLKGHLNKGHD